MTLILQEHKLHEQDSEAYSAEISEYNLSHSIINFGRTDDHVDKSKHLQNSKVKILLISFVFRFVLLLNN